MTAPSSRYIGNLPLEFYQAPKKARLLLASKAEANAILMYYEGWAPTYIGLGHWRLVARPAGAGTYELTCKKKTDRE